MPSRIDQMATIRRFVVFRCFRSNSVGLWHKVNRKLHEKNIVKPSTTPLLIRRSVHSCSEGYLGETGHTLCIRTGSRGFVVRLKIISAVQSEKDFTSGETKAREKTK